MPSTRTVRSEIQELKRRLYELERHLGTEEDAEPITGPEPLVLVARVGADPVAFLLEPLEEVVPFAKLAPLPEAPGWIRGILNLRGNMVPVIDVQARLARTAREAQLTDHIIVCTVKDRLVGLVVQRIEGVLRIGLDRFEEPPSEIPQAPYVLRIVRGDGAPLLLLSIHRLVSASSLPEVPA